MMRALVPWSRLAPKPMTKSNPERDAEMVRLFREGMSLSEIGALYGITRERVRQCLLRQGLTGKDGGIHVKALARTALREHRRREARERRIQRIYGCSIDELRDTRAKLSIYMERRIEQIYRSKRAMALRQGVAWQISFPEFVTLMRPHMNEYGLGRKNIVIRRKDLTAPYTIDNVELTTLSDSSRKTFERTRRIIELRLQGKTATEISAELGVPRSTVLYHIQRGTHGGAAKRMEQLLNE